MWFSSNFYNFMFLSSFLIFWVFGRSLNVETLPKVTQGIWKPQYSFVHYFICSTIEQMFIGPIFKLITVLMNISFPKGPRCYSWEVSSPSDTSDSLSFAQIMLLWHSQHQLPKDTWIVAALKWQWVLLSLLIYCSPNCPSRSQNSAHNWTKGHSPYLKKSVEFYVFTVPNYPMKPTMCPTKVRPSPFPSFKKTLG